MEAFNQEQKINMCLDTIQATIPFFLLGNKENKQTKNATCSLKAHYQPTSKALITLVCFIRLLNHPPHSPMTWHLLGCLTLHHWPWHQLLQFQHLLLTLLRFLMFLATVNLLSTLPQPCNS